MVPEVYQRFWPAMAGGEFITDAAAEAGTNRKMAARWLAACGGVRLRRGRDLKGRCLSFAEREEIALQHAKEESVRQIAVALERSPSTISRELHRKLRQYFPQGSHLSVHTEAHLDAVATELNDRPRKRLQFRKPIEDIGPLLLQ